MRDLKDLVVWQKAHAFALMVYKETKSFPSDERFGLVVQLRRAAVSIASNIAEGRGRGSDKDFARFLTISSGSLCECECQLLIARDLGYLTQFDVRNAKQDFETWPQLEAEIVGLKKLLSALLIKLDSEAPR